MKAKVKSLGSVVDLSEYVYDEDGNEYTWDEIELIDDDNWQHYRIQAAIAAMQGIIVSDAYADTKIVNNMTYEKSRTKWDNIKIAKAAVAHADALIKELKGGEDGQSD